MESGSVLAEEASGLQRQFDIEWEHILGHRRQQQELRRLIAEGRLPHALLFAGPEGVGKKLTARVVAAAVLCSQPANGAPCGHCESCLAMKAAAHPDYLELEPEARGKGAKVIRIESIRELTELAARFPVMSDRRVLLIDQVDLMNEPAANSLLKTLEEPPGQVTFILVTSARSALLDTIVSRCMPLSFGMLEREEIARALAGRGEEPGKAAALAALADGSLGRAIGLGERAGLSRRDEALDFLQGLPRMDMGKVWQESERLGSWDREDISEWLMYFNMLLRDLLVLYEDGASPLLYHSDCRDKLAELLPLFPEYRIFALLECTAELQRRLGANVNLRLQLEGFFIRLRDALI